MSLVELGIVVAGGLIGWAIVSWIISLVRQQKHPPVDIGPDGRRAQTPPAMLLPPPAGVPPTSTFPTGAPRAGGFGSARLPSGALPFPGAGRDSSAAAPLDFNSDASSPARARLSLADISAQWPTILGVTEGAGAQEIEDAYHAHLAECDRIRFAQNVSAPDKDDAEARRARVIQAYEFIRPLKSRS